MVCVVDWVYRKHRTKKLNDMFSFIKQAYSYRLEFRPRVLNRCTATLYSPWDLLGAMTFLKLAIFLVKVFKIMSIIFFFNEQENNIQKLKIMLHMIYLLTPYNTIFELKMCNLSLSFLTQKYSSWWKSRQTLTQFLSNWEKSIALLIVSVEKPSSRKY